METPYEAEEVLQDLLALEPKLLAGDSDSSGIRWLLIQQEKGVAAEEGGGSQWYLDHLFIDSEGTLTLVEVKRASDTRARREVVAQMLDYAANAAKGWDVEGLQAALSERCTEQGVDLSKAMQDFLSDGLSEEDFWERVADKLNSHSYRLVFVADEISPQLQSIVEYMNEQMSQTDVLALEVKQYLEEGGGRRIVVPRLIGQTSTATQKKAKGSGKRATPWTEEDLFSGLRASYSDQPEVAERMIQLFLRLLDAGGISTGGNGQSPSVRVTLHGGRKEASYPIIIRFYLDGPAPDFTMMREHCPHEVLQQLARSLAAIPGTPKDLATLEERNWGRHGAFSASKVFATDTAVDSFAEAVLGASSGKKGGY